VRVFKAADFFEGDGNWEALSGSDSGDSQSRPRYLINVCG